jgi:hypothetical protein
MEWVRYELPEESLREFVEVARGLTVGEYVYTPQKAKAE